MGGRLHKPRIGVPWIPGAEFRKPPGLHKPWDVLQRLEPGVPSVTDTVRRSPAVSPRKLAEIAVTLRVRCPASARRKP